MSCRTQIRPFPDCSPFFALVGDRRWPARLTEIRDLAASGPRAGHAILQRHAVELGLEKLRRHPAAKPSPAERLLGGIAAEIPAIAARLSPGGRERLIEQLRLGLSGQNTLIPLFHLVRTAMLQRSRGFTVAFAGLEDETPHDLLLRRDEHRGGSRVRRGDRRGRARACIAAPGSGWPTGSIRTCKPGLLPIPGGIC